ncbi:MAG: beta-hydroxyacyl-ACP dehydratase [Rhodospirillales bacterium]|nr:beta-hydroxyacyl-ACP dehydratase [Rhodospirillales bacterium]
MTSTFPLLRGFRPETPIGYRRGTVVTVAEFLHAVAALAATMPDRPYVANLCRDRVHFAVGLAAALLRGQITLLPPNETPGLLQQLDDDYPGFYCLADEAVPAAPRVLRYYARSHVTDAIPEIPAFAAVQEAVVLFTSGSTGRPVPQAKDWGTLVRSALAAGARLGAAGLQGASLLGTVPHQHSYGLESLIMLGLQHGMTLHRDRLFFPAAIAAELAAAPGVRMLVTTPIHLRVLLADTTALPHADLLLSATAPLPAELAIEAEARFGGPLYEIYGCSEAGQVAVRRTAATDEWQCIEGITLRQDGEDTWASGAAVPRTTLLGDIIELRSSERFLLHGRKADLVNIAGKRTSLAYLNHHLNAIDGVRDGVFVLPGGDDLGEGRLRAYVVAPGLTIEEIMAALRSRIDPAFLPRPLSLVEELPRNALGKLPRDALSRLNLAALD